MVTVLLVRHADVDALPVPGPDGPLLNAAGRARAEALVHVVGAAGVATLFTSEWRRTHQTLDPISATLKIAYAKVPAISALVEGVARGEYGSVVLVAGHSDTLPPMVAALTGSPQEPDIAAREFDNLFVVSVTGRGAGSFVRLKYGAHCS